MVNLSQLESLHRQIVGLRKAGSRFDVGLSRSPASLRRQLADIHSRLSNEGGKSPEIDIEELANVDVPTVYSDLLKSGKRRGRFSAGFESVIASSRRMKHLHVQLISSLAYPLVLTLLAIALFFFLSLRVVPQIFNTHGTIQAGDSFWWLPAKAVARLGSWWVSVIAIVMLVVTLLCVISGRIGSVFFWVPGVRAYYRDLRLADFAESVSEQWRNGVPHLEAIRIAAASNLDRATTRHVLNVVDADAKPGSGSGKNYGLLNWFLQSEDRQQAKSLQMVSQLYRIRAAEKRQHLVRILPVMFLVAVSVTIGVFYISTVWIPLCEILTELAWPKNDFSL